jgi:dephospho-CoA kinase
VLRVGLTGGIATGKTAVADQLAGLGATVVDADVLAREVVEPGTPGLAAVLLRFGTGVLTSDGRLDRPRLGRLVFADDAARRDLERIIHPRVRARAAELEQAADPDAVVVHVIPLLVETGQQDDFDVVVVVDLEPETQRRRLQDRNGLSAQDAAARLAAQAGRDRRLAAADLVVDNNGTPDQLRDAVARLWIELAERRPAG